MKRGLAEASLIMKPEGYKDGLLPSIKPINGDGDFTFSRGSNLAATRVNSKGLIEKGRENLLLQSNAFDTTWANVNSSETSGQSGYDGTDNAWLLSKSAASARVQQSISQNGVQTFSVYAKAGSLNFVMLNNGYVSQWFDLSNGTIGHNTSSANTIDANIEDIGSGWYKCSLSFNTSISIVRIYPSQADNDVSGTSGNIYIQDAQLEKGLVATDYIETGSSTAQAGILEDMPRINYDANGENGALLLEPSRTNLVTQSELFKGFFSLQGAAQIENDTTSPEGYQNALKMYPTATGVYKGYNKNFTSTLNNTAYTLSVYAKAAEFEHMFFYNVGAVGGNNGVWFNLSTGNVGTTQAAWSNAKMTDMGNGWYRCEATLTYGGSADFWYIFAADADGNATATASGTNGLYLYGAQMEEGSYITSYIPTHGAAVTRGADSCSVTGVSDVIGQSEGTAYLEIMYNNGGDAGVDASFFGLKNSAGTTYLNIYRLNSTLAFRFFNAGSNQFFHTETPTNETLLKIAFAYKANDFALYINGVQEATDTSGSVAGMSEVHLAGFSVGDNISDNYKTILFKERLTNSQLADLTA